MKKEPSETRNSQEEQLEMMFQNPLLADLATREVQQFQHLSMGFRHLALVTYRALPSNIDRGRALGALRLAFHHARESMRLEIEANRKKLAQSFEPRNEVQQT